MDTETFAVQVPKLDKAYDNGECGISGGDMYFQRSDSRVRFFLLSSTDSHIATI